jgi:hypothetical protein
MVVMNLDVLTVVGSLASSAPFLAILVILTHYQVRRAAWRRNQRLGRKNSGFCPSSSALGIALLVLGVFHRPSVQNTIEARLHQEADEDDNGDLETLTKQLGRQLRRIRRGEPVDNLILRI